METNMLDKIAPALARAQAEMSNPSKTKTANAGKYKYNYAGLAEIIDHVRPVLGKHALVITQLVDGAILRTLLMHESGQTLESRYALPTTAGAQEMGSAITYARRYSLCAILGIAAEEDDDGGKAEQAGAVENEIEKQARDTLFEKMGAANLGPVHVMAYVKANKLSLAKDVECLSLTSVQTLLTDWAKVVEASKPATTPVEKPAEAGADTQTDGLDGIHEDLVVLMRKDRITPAQLKAYYVGKGHLPQTVEPEKMPAAYRTKLVQNWAKAVEQIAQIMPF